MKKGNKRYYYLNENNEYVNTVVDENAIVPSHYIRGFKPKPIEQQILLREKMSKIHSGVPKTPECKEKMRQRKLGVCKTTEHKLNMSITHQKRIERVRVVIEQTNLSFREAVSYESRLHKSVNQPQWYSDLLQKQ